MTKLSLGLLELNTHDKNNLTRFYKDLIGLQVLAVNETSTELGFNSNPILRIIENKSLPEFSPLNVGLYHLALLFSSRGALTHVMQRILQTYPQLFTGSADHAVSEAFYFHDPDGNGLELYFDRNPNTWQWQNEHVVMTSEYIEPLGYIQKYQDRTASREQKLGHIHLQIGDIEQAKEFYVRTLGLKITAQLPGALFLSDGKYHHHLGLNTWHSEGQNTKIPSLGLKSFTLQMDRESLDYAIQQFSEKNTSFEKNNHKITLSDPWGTQLTLERAEEL